MKACLVRTMLAVIMLPMLAACGGGDPFPVNRGKPVFDPTATTEVTPVPLMLTPVGTERPLLDLPPLTNSQSSKTLALAGDVLITVNAESNTISLVDIRDERLIAEILVGRDPRTVALTPDGALALITLRGDNALAIVDLATRTLLRTLPVGHMPYGVVTDGRRAFVSSFADDQIAVIDLESGEVLHRVSVMNAPAGLVISGDWLLSTHLYSGYVSVFNVQRTPILVGSVNVEPDGNLAPVIALSADGQHAFIPQTRTGLALISLQYKQDWFAAVGVLNVTSLTGNRDARLTLSIQDDAANMPFDVAFDADGATLYVVLAGSDAVAVMDLESRTVRVRIPVGANPRGIAVSGGLAYVLNQLDGTVSVIDTIEQKVVNTIQVTTMRLDPALLRGKVLFNRASSSELSDGAISCATCHFDGGADARTWINFRSGPRNTPSLGGISMLPPYNWAGDMNELHDTIEDQIRNVMLGDGLIRSGEFDPTVDRVDAGRSVDLDALVAYVASLEPWPNPNREPDGSLSESAQRGMQLFLSGSPNCGCHAPPLYTDLLQHSLSGTAFSMENFAEFDTPTLRGLWASAPYMHDGVVQTLIEVLSRTDPVHSVAAGLSEQELADLIAFLLSL